MQDVILSVAGWGACPERISLVELADRQLSGLSPDQPVTMRCSFVSPRPALGFWGWLRRNPPEVASEGSRSMRERLQNYSRLRSASQMGNANVEVMNMSSPVYRQALPLVSFR